MRSDHHLGEQATHMAATHAAEHAAANASRVGELEKIVGFLLAKLIQGEQVSLADDAVRRFLRIPQGAEVNPETFLQQVLGRLEPRGLLECPSCESKLKDIPGFLDEKCPVCGSFVGSDS